MRPRLTMTPEQAVVFDDARAIVTVCPACGAAEHPTNAELQRYLAPNAWVRSDDAEIRSLALNTVMRGASTDYRMRKLTELVVRRMRGGNDFLGYADAVTALHTGSGDCTEFAVLLAALARAQGIPARIAVFIYY
jgi:transglutaminase-like putative cysteine protease